MRDELTTEKALKKLKGKFEILGRNINKEFVELLVDKKDIIKVLKSLKETPELKCNNLHCLTGVDYKEHMEVVYHLYSYELEHKIVVKARVTREDPKIDSAYSLWKTADWQEREAYELYGIEFKGHPNLKALLLTDDFPGFPYRKDVPLENNEEWLLENDGHSNKEYGIPIDLDEIYKQRLSKSNGGRNKK